MTLESARLYLVAPGRLAAGRLVDLLPGLAEAGVGIVQLREKTLEAGEIVRLAEPLAALCRSLGVPFVINDRPDIAVAVGADGVHVGQEDLPVAAGRRVVGPGAVVGVSTHATSEIDAALAARPGLDYIAVGPVHATPTKPERPGTGLELVRHAARVIPDDVPWFVTGGMNLDTIPSVLDAGGRRVVVVRGITEAADPVAAAAAIYRLLQGG